jgi:uncharacterized tellurite resistance protein B-like protein
MPLTDRLSAPAARIRAEIAERTGGLFDAVLEERRRHYEEHPESAAASGTPAAITRRYAKTNMTISGGVSLVPGPWGMIAAVPEITVVVRNQIAMIHDIGRAYGKGSVLTRELLAGIFLTGLGGSAGALLTIHGGKVLVRRASLRFFQQVVVLMAGRVTQKVLRSAIAKYLPLFGAAAMGGWSYYMTRRIGALAEGIFEKDIELLDEVLDAEVEEVADQEIPEFASAHDALRIRALIDLVRVDGTIAPDERAYLHEALEQAPLPPEERFELLKAIDAEQVPPVDVSPLRTDPDEAIALLLDMVALAQCDGTLHRAEFEFIRSTAGSLGVSDEELGRMVPSVKEQEAETVRTTPLWRKILRRGE